MVTEIPGRHLMMRPESAPNLLSDDSHRKGPAASSVGHDVIGPRPGTAPVFLTEERSGQIVQESINACRNRRISSVSAMLQARKMIFAESSPTDAKHMSDVMERGESADLQDNDEEEGPESPAPRLVNKSMRKKKRFEKIIER
jgi:hypothetical protein